MTQTQCPSCGQNIQYFEDCIRGRLSCPACGETVDEFPAAPLSFAAAPVPGEPSELEFDVLALFRVLMAGATAGAFIALPLSFILNQDYVKTLTLTAPVTALLLVLIGLGVQTTRGAASAVFRAIQVVFVLIFILSALVVAGLKIYVEAKRTGTSHRHGAPTTLQPSRVQPSPISGR